MENFFKKLLANLKNLFSKLSGTQKLILVGVVALVVVGLIFLLSFSSKQTEAYLFESPIEQQDFTRITNKLTEWNAAYRTREGKFIVVKDEQTGAYLRMKLGQAGVLPSGIKGWELFDTQSWTTTDFERDINKRRAIIGEITRHIKLLDDVEDVSIQVTMPKPELYIDEEVPYTASVIITPSPYSDILTNKKKIMGIIDLIAFGVDRLSPENVVVTDHHGNILSDFTAEDEVDYLSRAKEEWKIKERLRLQMQNGVSDKLKAMLGVDKVDVSVELELDFDQKKVEKTEFIPIVKRKDNPETPYDETEVELNVVRSAKDTTEHFEGVGFVPEGPPGVEPNIPPGYKEAMGEGTKYDKAENVRNYEISQQVSSIVSSPYKINRLSVAVWVDGTWEKLYDEEGKPVMTEEGGIQRNYISRTSEEMKSFEEIVKGAIGYSPARRDTVIVKNIQFDRTEEFALEDAYLKKREQLRKTLISALIALFAIFIVTIAYRAISREVSRRKRIKEEELARQQQLMREAALKSAEEEGVEIELSAEERARLEMQENVMNIAREHPEEVAKLIRTWLAEE
ncbi:MAG TPA: flagellar basal-body MS-ring/collar protein FliF [Spirochaetota bacterium]|nr:flagellar basal-body MS-ring/collar protein FliF [Spirochaetota bacterium]